MKKKVIKKTDVPSLEPAVAGAPEGAPGHNIVAAVGHMAQEEDKCCRLVVAGIAGLLAN